MFLTELSSALSSSSSSSGGDPDGGNGGEGGGQSGGQGPADPVEIAGFKFFPKDRRMALISFPSIEIAVLALIVSPQL